MSNQVFNPYLPSWEYIPDGEPHVFGDRVYVYGSHDLFNGCVFCLGDYVCYSAPVDNLKDWRYEGVIYKRLDDPINKDGKMVLYAPDVTQGSDGRYYLYYVYDKIDIVSVAVCDTPAGEYKFYGYVHYKDGTLLGKRAGDEPQFDPGVLTEGEKTYLYTGFCDRSMTDRHGAMCTVLGKDMLTIEEDPVIVAPSFAHAKGSTFEGHEFFEASSIRKEGDTYYFIYSSVWMHELCYATSKSPTKDFTYRGVIVSNADLYIDSYKKPDFIACYGGNNHGGIEKINGEWYIFYHRQTNGTWYSRQGCAEKIKIENDGSIKQVEMTSCGLNGGSLEGRGEYFAYLACNMFIRNKPCLYVTDDYPYPKITQDGRDGDEIPGHITNIKDGTVIGFKYFNFKGIKKFTIKTRGYCSGTFEVKTSIDGECFGKIKVENTNFWQEFTTDANIPDGTSALYLEYKGPGNASLLSFTADC